MAIMNDVKEQATKATDILKSQLDPNSPNFNQNYSDEFDAQLTRRADVAKEDSYGGLQARYANWLYEQSGSWFPDDWGDFYLKDPLMGTLAVGNINSALYKRSGESQESYEQRISQLQQFGIPSQYQSTTQSSTSGSYIDSTYSDVNGSINTVLDAVQGTTVTGTLSGIAQQSGIDVNSLIPIAVARGADPNAGWLYTINGEAAIEAKLKELMDGLKDLWPDYADNIDIAPVGMPDHIAVDLGMIPQSEVAEYVAGLASITPPGFTIIGMEQGQPLFQLEGTNDIFTLTELANHGVYGDFVRAGLGIQISTASGWEMLGGGNWKSPEGLTYTFSELVDEYYNLSNAIVDTDGDGIISEREFRAFDRTTVAQYQMERFAQLTELFETLFPAESMEEILGWIETDPEGFTQSIREIGRNQQTEQLVQFLWPEASDAQVAGFFLSDNDIKTALRGVFSEDKVNALWASIRFDKGTDTSNPMGAFISEMQKIGRNEETEALLNELFPDMDEGTKAFIFNEPYLTFEQWLEAQKASGRDLDPDAPETEKKYQKWLEAAKNTPDWLRSLSVGFGNLLTSIANGATWINDNLNEPDGDEGEFALETIADTLNGMAPSLYAYKVLDTDPDKFNWTDVWTATLENAPIMGVLAGVSVLTYGGATATAAGIVAKTGLNAFWKTAIPHIVGSGIGGGVTASFESALEAANIYDQLLIDGTPQAEAMETANTVFWQNMAVLGATNFAEFGMAFFPMGRAASKTIKGLTVSQAAERRGFIRILRDDLKLGGKITGVAITETGQEIVQEYINRNALGLPFELDEEMKLVVYVSLVYGAGFGSVGAGYTQFMQNTKNNLPMELQADIDIKTAGLEGEELAVALTDAFNELIETNQAEVEQAIDFTVQDLALQRAENSEQIIQQLPLEGASTEQVVSPVGETLPVGLNKYADNQWLTDDGTIITQEGSGAHARFEYDIDGITHSYIGFDKATIENAYQSYINDKALSDALKGKAKDVDWSRVSDLPATADELIDAINKNKIVPREFVEIAETLLNKYEKQGFSISNPEKANFISNWIKEQGVVPPVGKDTPKQKAAKSLVNKKKQQLNNLKRENNIPVTEPAVEATRTQAEEIALFEADIARQEELEALRNHPVLAYRGTIGKRKVSLMYFLNRPGRKGDWPETITAKEVRFFENSIMGRPGWEIKTGRNKGRYDFGKTIQQFAETFNMTEDEVRAVAERYYELKNTVPQVTFREIEAAEARLEAINERVDKAVEEGGKITNEGEVRSLGAAAMLDMRTELANSLMQEAAGQGVYKTAQEIRAQLENLPDYMVKRLWNQYVNKYIMPADMAELERWAEYTKRTGVPKDYINTLAAKTAWELEQNVYLEQWGAIKDSPLDKAMVYYKNTGDFDGMVDMLPRVDELKLKALGETVINNMTELNDLIVSNEKLIAETETQLAQSDLTKEAVKQSTSDISMLKQHNKQIDQMIKELRGGKKFTVEDAAALGIALRGTKGGKIVPALRESGFYVTEEFANSTSMRDVGYRDGLWMDITTLFHSIDGGTQAMLKGDSNGVAQKYIMYPARSAALAGMNFQAIQQKKVQDKLAELKLIRMPKSEQQDFVKVIEMVSSQDAALTTAELMNMPAIKAVINKYSKARQTQIVEGARFVRGFFDEMIAMVNKVREARGQELIEFRQNYLPQVIKANIWNKLGILNQTREQVMQTLSLPNFHPNKTFNERALAREHNMSAELRETDVRKIMFDYIHVSMKDIYYTSVVQNIKIHTAVMESMGLKQSARLIQDWGSEAYAGTKNIFDRAVEAILPPVVTKTIYRIRRNLTRAVFPFNVVWNLTIQPTSAAFTVARAGIRASSKAVDVFFDSDARAQAEATYAFIIKSKNAGKMAYQDLGQALGRINKAENTVIDNVESAGNFLTNFIEKNLTLWSARAGYYLGTRLGYDGRALQEFSSDMAAKTQSMYNREDVPAMIRSRMISSFFPFQTFLFQSFNFVRETMPVLSSKTKTGAYKTVARDSAAGGELLAKRMKIWLSFVGLIIAINMVGDRLNDRKPWVVSSFIPFFAILQGMSDSDNPWRQPTPDQFGIEFWNAFDSLIKYDDWTKMRKWFVRYNILGGTQLNRTLDGLIALAKGEQTDVRGKKLFDVNSDEWFTLITQGPYKTEAGQEYVDSLRKDENFWMQWFGFAISDRLDINGEIENALDMMGTPDASGRLYNFGDVVSTIKSIKSKVGANRWNSANNPLIVDYKTAETYTDELGTLMGEWAELSASERSAKRDEWLRLNPEADAYMSFYDISSGRIQTMEAYELVKDLAEKHNISLDSLNTWLPPENVANAYFIYQDAAFSYTGKSFGSSSEARKLRERYPELDAWGNYVGWWSVTHTDQAAKILEDMISEYIGGEDAEETS